MRALILFISLISLNVYAENKTIFTPNDGCHQKNKMLFLSDNEDVNNTILLYDKEGNMYHKKECQNLNERR